MSFKNTLLINCGASHLTSAVVTAEGGKVRMEKFQTQQLDYDYSNEDRWLPTLQNAIRDMFGKTRHSGEVALIMPGHQLLTRFINVPLVDPERQRQTIAHEVAQKMPYALSGVEWDTHEVANDGVEMKLLVLAVKQDIVNSLCETLNGLGLEVTRVMGDAPLDFNAYHYANLAGGGDVLFINIGARSINLMFTAGDELFLRSINFGGNMLTQSIADSLGTNFISAETTKLEHVKTGAIDANSDEGQVVKTQAEAFTKRLNTEITRSIALFRREYQGKKPAKVFMTGGGAQLPGLAEALNEKLKVDVEVFDPMPYIEAGAKSDPSQLQASSYQLSEFIGGSASDEPGNIRISLLPQAQVEQKEFEKRKMWLALAALFLAIAGLAPAAKAYMDYQLQQDNLQAVQAQIAPLETQAAEIATIEEQVQAIRDKISRIEELVNSRVNWNNFFVDLQEQLQAVEDVWLQSLRVVRPVEQEEERRGGGLSIGGSRSQDEQPAAEKPREPLKLALTGRMIDRANPTAFVSENIRARANRLINSFAESEFIEDVENVRLESREGILQFEVTLIVNPEKPL